MRSAARFIVTMSIALVLVPALYADDAAKPATEATKDETAASAIVQASLPRPSQIPMHCHQSDSQRVGNRFRQSLPSGWQGTRIGLF